MKTNMAVVVALCAVCCRVSLADVVAWEFPRMQPQEGIPFADSKTGILVWNGDGYLDVTVGRGDWWEHRGGSVWQDNQSYAHIVELVKKGDRKALQDLFTENPAGNPRMLPLGRVRFDLGGARAVRGGLDPMTGLGSITFEKDGSELTAELAMSFGSGAFAIKWPAGLVPKGRAIAAWDSVIGDETTPRCRASLEKRGYAPPAYRGNADGFSGGFTQTAPAGEASAEMDFVTRNGETFVTSARGANRVGVLAKLDFAAVRADSLKFWSDWWRDAPKISVPDPEIAEMYYFGMYKFGAMTDESGIPAGLQGQWLEDFKFPPWNGDYHFNINVEECYWPAYHGNKVRNLLPLFRMIRSWWPVLRANAKAFMGIDDGFVLPHAVDDRGTCIGGFWTGTIDHGSTAWVASMMFRYVRYSNDLDFLKTDAFPFMKGAFNVYRGMMTEDGDRLCIPVGPSPEYGWKLDEEVNKNSSFQLAAAHRLTRDLIKAAEMLGETPDPRWLYVEKRLPAFGVAMDDECKKGAEIGVYDGIKIRMSHRHHSHLAGLVPFDTVDLKANFKTVRTTMWWFGWQGPGMWAGWSYPWASMIYTHVGEPAAAYWALKCWNFNFVNPGHGSRHNHYYHGLSIMGRDPMTRNGDYAGNEIMQMDGQMAATAAVQDMMVHERGGVVRLFAGCPDRWKTVSFDGMLVDGGFRVSAERKNGKLTRLEVIRPEGSTEKLLLEDPETGKIIER